MTHITTEQVRHLAKLARISLTPSEVERYAQDLSQILHAVETVREAAGDDIIGTSHPIPLSNVMRPDQVADLLDRDAVLRAAPDHDGTRFRVSAILGEEQ